MVKILYFLSTYILIKHYVELSFIIFATILRNDISYYRILFKKKKIPDNITVWSQSPSSALCSKTSRRDHTTEFSEWGANYLLKWSRLNEDDLVVLELESRNKFLKLETPWRPKLILLEGSNLSQDLPLEMSVDERVEFSGIVLKNNERKPLLQYPEPQNK